MELVELNGLMVPVSYAIAPVSERLRVCNGCGLSGWKGKLVPDSMWGLDISEACHIHDWCYHEGTVQADKDAADMLFLRNLLRLINARGGLIAPLRRYRAMTYYNAVCEFGGNAFHAGK